MDGLEFESGQEQEIFLFFFFSKQNAQTGPPNLLPNEYRASFSGVKGLGCGVNYSPPSSAEIEFG
jgi:hypothetical protein